MRRNFSVVLAAVAACLFVAGSAGAAMTVDLVWLDNSATTLTVSAGDTGNHACDGFNNSAAGRCMKVVLTVDESAFLSQQSVSWSNSIGLTAAHAAMFPKFQAIAVGKNSDPFGPFPNAHFPTNGINNPVGIISSFAAGVTAAGADPNVTYLGAGTYTLGTIVWDVSSTVVGSHLIDNIIVGGLDGFIDSTGGIVNSIVTLNTATLNVVPEPGTASLLGLGLLGLLVASRRRSG